MDANSLRTHRFKAQLSKFSGIISRQFSKPKRRLIKELIYGIQASKDIKLSNVARSLQEDIPLIKTEDRLSRNLCDEDFTEVLNNEILRLGDDKITQDMVIAIDPGDIMKPYAKAMEYLCGIYDGSEKEKAIGYHLCQVTGANLEHNKIVPLYSEAFSSKEKGYVSIAEKMKDIIRKVKGYIGTVGTWAIDRQGDDVNLFNFFDAEQLKFVTRLKLDRWLYTHNINGGVVPVQAERLRRHMSLSHRAQITKIDDGKETVLNLQFGITRVAVYDQPKKWYNVVVIVGFGQDPMVLFTNLEVNSHQSKAIYKVVEIFLTRWKCEECYRYIKQSYNLEDVRVRSYVAIRNITVIVNAIAYFTSIYMGHSEKLKLMVQKIFILSKRFFGIPTFFNYAMADGIAELLKKDNIALQDINYKGKTGISSAGIQLDLYPN
jgi:hypothetical protein